MKFSCEAFALSVLTALAAEARRGQRVPHRQIAELNAQTEPVNLGANQIKGGDAKAATSASQTWPATW